MTLVQMMGIVVGALALSFAVYVQLVASHRVPSRLPLAFYAFGAGMVLTNAEVVLFGMVANHVLATVGMLILLGLEIAAAWAVMVLYRIESPADLVAEAWAALQKRAPPSERGPGGAE